MSFEMIFLIWATANLVIGGLIGQAKGRPVAGIIWALLAGPIGWIVMLIVPDQRRKCPFCAEAIKAAAKVCPHCQRDLPAPPTADRRLRMLGKPGPKLGDPPRKTAADVDQVEQWAREHPDQANG